MNLPESRTYDDSSILYFRISSIVGSDILICPVTEHSKAQYLNSCMIAQYFSSYPVAWYLQYNPSHVLEAITKAFDSVYRVCYLSCCRRTLLDWNGQTGLLASPSGIFNRTVISTAALRTFSWLVSCPCPRSSSLTVFMRQYTVYLIHPKRWCHCHRPHRDKSQVELHTNKDTLLGSGDAIGLRDIDNDRASYS